MTINFREEYRKALLEELTGAISSAEIKDNGYLNTDSFQSIWGFEDRMVNAASSKQVTPYSLVRKEMTEVVGLHPLYTFFTEEIQREIQQNRKDDSTNEAFLLTSLEHFDAPTTAAERLVENFQALPRKYKIFIRLPVYGFKELLGNRFDLDSRISLIIPDDGFPTDYPPPLFYPDRGRGFSVWFRPPAKQPLNWSQQHVYCELSVDGYIGLYAETSAITLATYLLRAFCGLCLALKLFDVGYQSFLREECYLKVYEQDESTWRTMEPRRPSTELDQGLDRLQLATPYGKPLASLIQRTVPPALSLIKNLLLSEQNERLLLAAQWYFDSFCGQDELLSFIKATTCFEILLGDKKVSDKIGIMELLRNRAAYLLGNNHRERGEISKRVGELYDTRSEIVHNGRNRLSSTDRNNLFELRSLCARVIKKELLVHTA